ncbi:DUF4350 domain-containing protein [Salinibacterium sp. M195]|uniref:DUF4350 domain-containing protein n=1 Tax=Salinibacterium sp. M195 TaxID=2583374 RepID=UPI001C634BB8|nr:DUF4350 domain-containing protein [Salinibacterium sp. M195]QYH35633.1 DUF4350 domain-containing protein [Salinibacterium sp. M195]
MSAPTVVTPSIRRVVVRSLFWIIAALFLLGIALISLSLVGTAADREPLDPASPNQSGTRALAEVLRQQGVDVIETTSLDQTRDALRGVDESTLFFADLNAYLLDDQIAEAVGLASTVIYAEPSIQSLLEIAPEVSHANTPSGTVAANCSAKFATNSPSITAGPLSLDIVDDTDATVCYGDGDAEDGYGYGVVSLDRGDTRLVLLGATTALTNESISSADNAAFAFSLLGQNSTLVWYTPSFADFADDGGVKTLDELAPDWMLPVVWLAAVTLLVAALWRGRRFGPLVIEKLPVIVRSSETMQGRARLYEKTAARLHTLDSLRIGSLRRLAALCGMATAASVDDVINRIALLTDQPTAPLRNLLIDSAPITDNDLLELSDALLTLEQRVESAVRPT